MFVCLILSVCMCVCKSCQNALTPLQIKFHTQATQLMHHFVTFNCGGAYVCVCVFLLSTAHHRNGKPVSTATLFCVNLKQGWMLHVTNYSGNVVMVLCISLSQASSILLLRGSLNSIIFTRRPNVMSSVDMEGLFVALYMLIRHLHVSLPSTLPSFSKFAHICPACLKHEPYPAVYSICLFDKQAPLAQLVVNAPIAWNVSFKM